jgi:hypothetical protein
MGHDQKVIDPYDPTAMTDSSGSVSAALVFAERLAAICARTLGESVTSVILHGSLALDDFTTGRSDIDPLMGADPRELVGAIPDEWVLSIGDAYLARWESLTADSLHAELMVLTACRIWRFSEEGNHCSKAAAGTWALDRDPSLDAVRDALRQRRVDPTQPIEPAEIGRLLGIVRAHVAARRARMLS